VNGPLLLLAAAILGALVGCLTGLLPGLHVNTLSVVLLAFAPLGYGAMSAIGVASDLVPITLAALLLGITISHTFVNIIPATYLGAPDESTALSILPAHRLLLRGDGYRAVAISAYASYGAVALSLVCFWPAEWVLVRAAPAIKAATPALLVLLVAFLVHREPGRLGPEAWPAAMRRFLARMAAFDLFLAAGLFGLVSFQLNYRALVPLPPSPLLPALGGLFGAATLLEALAQHARVPHQFLRMGQGRVAPAGAAASLAAGVAAGAGMSLFPGLTNATATAVATAARKGTDEEVLVSLGAVNTANAVFNLLVLALFDHARSGAVVALRELLPVESWTGPVPAQLVWFLFATLAGAFVSLVATLALGRWAARRIHAVPYRRLVVGVLVYVTLVAWLFTGWTGLAVFAVGTALGLLTVRLGLQRTHLTGVLLVPVLGYFWLA